MRFRELQRRELRIVLGARVTWFVLAASALLVGHSFVLALDLFSAASRSALGFTLMQREMDPLAGIVRPMLGGLHLSTALLVPVLAARGLAIERERRSYAALALAAGGTMPIVVAKGIAACAAALLLIAPVLALAALFALLGGHVDAIETSVALAGHVLHVLALTAVALAAAAASRSVAQATTAAVAVSLASWSVDAAAGFAALAWLGRLDWASISRQLEPFEQGIVPLGSLAWLISLALTAGGSALLFARIERPALRFLPAGVVLALGAGALAISGSIHRGFDWSEQQRMSLPPAVVAGLRAIPQPIRVELYLDRDDGRRAQVERSTLSRLRLARSDLVIEAPLDAREHVREGERSDAYGRIVVHVGTAARETRSTSRKEITTLIFEAAGRRLPDWEQSAYPGYPIVIQDSVRTVAAIAAYLGLPAAFAFAAWLFTRIPRRRP